MKKVFNETGDFAAIYAAEKWLKENGYSVGSMQSDAPMGIMKGDYSISKWRNLSRDEIKRLDGVVEGKSKRNGPITVTIYEKGDTSRPSYSE